MINKQKTKLYVGMEVSRWTVLGRADDLISSSGRHRSRWNCRCVCGVTKAVLEQSLVLALRSDQGGSRSCGCLARDVAMDHGHAQGGRPSPEYMCWLAAKKRCNNPTNASYATYGARGIHVCGSWSESFETFLKDVGRKPRPDWSLDRIDPDRGYEPGNCAWVPPIVQARNKRTTQWYEFEGQPAVIGEVARFLGVSRHAALKLENRGLLPARRMLRAPAHELMGRPLVLDLNQTRPLRAVLQNSGGRHA